MKMTLNEIFARNVWSVMLHRHISITALYMRSGISKTQIDLILKGKANPTLKTVEAIAEGLQISPVMLIQHVNTGEEEWQSNE